VRSVPESQEWEVIVEPSIEASRPTRTLVQESNSRGSPPRTAVAREAGKTDRAAKARPSQRTKKKKDLGFLMGRLLRGVYSTPPRRRSNPMEAR